MAIPGWLLTETVTVQPLTTPPVAGPSWAAAQTVRAHVQEGRKLVRGDKGTLAEATINIFLRPDVDIPVGSRLTLRGQTCTAVAVDVNTTRGLAPHVDHLDVWCELCAFLPTTTVTITRGTPTLDAFGDPVDNNSVVAAGVPAAFIEDRQQRYDRADERGGVVEQFTIRLASTAQVLEGDRITDDVSAAVFQVFGVAYPPAAVGPELGDSDVRVMARRVGATSVPPTT